jgi:hypothetical protein
MACLRIFDSTMSGNGVSFLFYRMTFIGQYEESRFFNGEARTWLMRDCENRRGTEVTIITRHVS